MFGQVKDIFSKRQLLFTLSLSDFKKKFIGSYLGIFWMFVQPIVSIFIYYLIFQVGFKSSPVEDMPYVLWLIPGIIPWFYFNEALSNGVSVLSAYQHLVKKMVFRIDLLPLVKVVSSLFVHFIFLFIMVIVFLLYGVVPSLWWLQCIYYLLCNIILVTGMIYLTSSVNVFIKDVGQIVNVVLQFGFWMTPIMWDLSIMPEALHLFLKLNPFTYVVKGFRDSFIYHVGFWEKPEELIYYWVVTSVIFICGIRLFKKMEPHFADVL